MADTATLRVRADTTQAERALGRLQTALGGLVTVAAARALADVVATFEDLQTTLNTVTKSATNGQAAFRAISRFATETQFSIEDLTTTYIQLASAGITPTERLLRTFTDAAAVTTDQLGSLQAITALFSRTTAGGLGLEELNRLADRGIPVFDILSEKIGVSRLEISELGKSAEGARKILAALESGINERFGGATQARLNNLSTIMSNFGIQTRISANILGQEMSPAIKEVIQDLTVFLQKNDQLVKSVGVGLGDAIRFTADGVALLARNFDLITAATITLLSVRAFGSLQAIISRIARNTSGAKTAAGALSGGIKGLASGAAASIPGLTFIQKAFSKILLFARLNPFTAIASAILGLIVANNGLGRTLAQVSRAFEIIGNGLARIFGPAINFVADSFTKLQKIISDFVVSALETFATFGEFILEKLLPDAAFQVFKSNIRGFIAEIKAAGQAYDEAQMGLDPFGGAGGATAFPELNTQPAGTNTLSEQYKKEFEDSIKSGRDFLRSLMRQSDERYRVDAEYFENRRQLEDLYANDSLFKFEQYQAALSTLERQYQLDRISAEMQARTKAAEDSFKLRNQELIQAQHNHDLQLEMVKKELDAQFFAVNQKIMMENEYYDIRVANEERLLALQQKQNEIRFREMGFSRDAAIDMARERADFDKKTELEKAQFAIQQTASVFDNLGQRNKAAFQAAKAFNIANAIMNTYAGATKALSMYPPPFNFIAAAAVVASGLAQVAAIRAQTYSGRALGGPMVGGQQYIVGERGPELITAPSGGGRVTPNDEMGGVTNITFQIQTNDARGFDQLLAERKGMIINMVRQAQTDKGRRATV